MSKPATCSRLLRRWLLRRRAALRAERTSRANAIRSYADAPAARPLLPAPAPVLLLPAVCASSIAATRYVDNPRATWEAGKVKVAREGAALLDQWRAGLAERPAYLNRYLSTLQAQMHIH